MPASIGPGCFTSSPGVKSGLIRYTRNALGLLNATRMFSEGMSVVMWIGRVGSGIASPCLVSAPLAGSMRNAVTRCSVPAGPYPDALLLVATDRYRRETCGQPYCTPAGRVTVARLVSSAPDTLTSY